jgi:hypothetical protein
MRLTLLLPFFICLMLSAFTQQRYSSKFLVDTKFKDTFSFAGKWHYPWHTLKWDDGRFSSGLSDSISAADTMHMYYTANCRTNVQGGYQIKYCYASRDGSEMVLTFSDGLPAYASEFRVHIKNDSFYFQPEMVYPAAPQGEKITFRIDKEKLTLNKTGFEPGELVKGYAEFEFTEQTETPGKPLQARKYYLKGFFRTPLPLQNSYFVGLEEKCWVNEKGKKECYTDPANPQRKWYNYSEVRLKGDSVFVDQMSVAIYKKDTAWSASDGGFYYWTGTWQQDGSSILLDLTELYCDYCPRRVGAQKRTKLWYGRITDQGILINGQLFRASILNEPLDSELGRPRR